MPGQDVAVPSVIGLPQSQAEAQLQNAGLVLGKVTKVPSANVPPGSVIGANQQPGALVNPGSSVDLDVSSGPTPIGVPKLVGLTRPAAEAILKSAGLVPGAVKTQHSNSVPADGIIGTNPDAGTLVSPASPVELQLSSGPETNWTQYIPTVLFAILGAILLWVLVHIVTKDGREFLQQLANIDVARGLITFLIAIATVGIAIILAVSTLVLTEGDQGDKRFDRGKQVLSILIGVLGTIVGFYFGSAQNIPKQPTEQTVSAPSITTTALRAGTTNEPYELTTLETTGLIKPLKWTVSPALPAGLVLDPAAGTIGGTPTAPTSKSYKFAVTDSAKPPVALTRDITLEIKSPP